MTQKVTRLGMLIMVLVLGMVVAGCDNPTRSNDDNGIVLVPLALRGTWLEADGDQLVTFTNTTMINPSFQSAATITAVEEVINTRTDEDVNIYFPKGYRITMIQTAVPEGFEEFLGLEAVMSFYLSNDGNSFWLSVDITSSLPPSNLWVKE